MIDASGYFEAPQRIHKRHNSFVRTFGACNTQLIGTIFEWWRDFDDFDETLIYNPVQLDHFKINQKKIEKNEFHTVIGI